MSISCLEDARYLDIDVGNITAQSLTIAGAGAVYSGAATVACTATGVTPSSWSANCYFQVIGRYLTGYIDSPTLASAASTAVVTFACPINIVGGIVNASTAFGVSTATPVSAAESASSGRVTVGAAASQNLVIRIPVGAITNFSLNATFAVNLGA